MKKEAALNIIKDFPQEFELETLIEKLIFMEKVGNSLQIIPFHNAWQNLIDSLDNFTLDFMDSREQPGNQMREPID